MTNPGAEYELRFTRQGREFGSVKVKPWAVVDVTEYAQDLLYQFNAARNADKCEIRRDGQFVRTLSLYL